MLNQCRFRQFHLKLTIFISILVLIVHFSSAASIYRIGWNEITISNMDSTISAAQIYFDISTILQPVTPPPSIDACKIDTNGSTVYLSVDPNDVIQFPNEIIPVGQTRILTCRINSPYPLPIYARTIIGSSQTESHFYSISTPHSYSAQYTTTDGNKIDLYLNGAYFLTDSQYREPFQILYKISTTPPNLSSITTNTALECFTTSTASPTIYNPLPMLATTVNAYFSISFPDHNIPSNETIVRCSIPISNPSNIPTLYLEVSTSFGNYGRQSKIIPINLLSDGELPIQLKKITKISPLPSTLPTQQYRFEYILNAIDDRYDDTSQRNYAQFIIGPFHRFQHQYPVAVSHCDVPDGEANVLFHLAEDFTLISVYFNGPNKRGIIIQCYIYLTPFITWLNEQAEMNHLSIDTQPLPMGLVYNFEYSTGPTSQIIPTPLPPPSLIFPEIIDGYQISIIPISFESYIQWDFTIHFGGAVQTLPKITLTFASDTIGHAVTYSVFEIHSNNINNNQSTTTPTLTKPSNSIHIIVPPSIAPDSYIQTSLQFTMKTTIHRSTISNDITYIGTDNNSTPPDTTIKISYEYSEPVRINYNHQTPSTIDLETIQLQFPVLPIITGPISTTTRTVTAPLWSSEQLSPSTFQFNSIPIQFSSGVFGFPSQSDIADGYYDTNSIFLSQSNPPRAQLLYNTQILFSFTSPSCTIIFDPNTSFTPSSTASNYFTATLPNPTTVKLTYNRPEPLFTRTDVDIGVLNFSITGRDCDETLSISITQPFYTTPALITTNQFSTRIRNFKKGIIYALFHQRSQAQDKLWFQSDIEMGEPSIPIVDGGFTNIELGLASHDDDSTMSFTAKLIVFREDTLMHEDIPQWVSGQLTTDQKSIISTLPDLSQILPLSAFSEDYGTIKAYIEITWTSSDSPSNPVLTTYPFVFVPECITMNSPQDITSLCQNGKCGGDGNCRCDIGFTGQACEKRICSTNESHGNECEFNIIHPPLLPPTSNDPNEPQQPPIITTTLPLQLVTISSLCNIVIDVNKQYQLINGINDKRYDKMCSIPTSGILISQELELSKLNDNTTYPQHYYPTIYNHFTTQQPQLTTLRLCDCLCQGYWIDNPFTLDYKKCTTCDLTQLQCSTYMTPNYDCTACECSTPECKKYTTYLFSTLYLQPQILQYIVTPLPNNNDILLSTDLISSSTELNKYLYSPTPIIKSKYYTIMNQFQSHLLRLYQIKYNLNPTLYISYVQNVIITPLIEGSFTTWKITLLITNSSKQPLTILYEKSKSYGLPILDQPLSLLFIRFLQQQSITTNGITFSPTFMSTLEQLISSPTLPTTTTTSSSPLMIKWFTSDIFTTQCLSSKDFELFKSNNYQLISTMIPKPCPLPQQYIHSNDINKLELFNPMWSQCTDSTSLFNNYELLLTKNEVITNDNNTEQSQTKVKLYSRQIYPICIDFTGKNVNEYYIPCSLPMPYYSNKTQSLLSPLYISLLTSTINLPSYQTTTELQNDNKYIIQRLNTIRSYQLPKFPQFPQSIFTLCSTSTITDNNNGSGNNDNDNIPNQCEFPKYGTNCENEYNFGNNNDNQQTLTLSPTQLTIDSHAHFSWQYQGDNNHEVTLILKSNHNNNRNATRRHFIWSQNLGTFPMSYLYSTPQLPTFSNSILFSTIYTLLNQLEQQQASSLSTIDNNFLQYYSKSTNITIQGYLTKKADYNLQFDLDSTSLLPEFELSLPMLCNHFNITTCHDNDKQYCNQAIGRCECRIGYIRVGNNTNDNEQQQEQDNGDGTLLQCESICLNNGQYNINTNSCECNENTYGQRCEILTTCQNEQQQEQCNLKNGYIPFDYSTNSCNNDQCICYGHWLDNDHNPLSSTETATPKCSYCPLKPFNTPYYSQDELQQLTSLLEKYEIDDQHTQTYQHYHNDNSPQRCYYSGTNITSFNITTIDDNNNVYSTFECEKCHCKYGYGGQYCQLHVVYTNFTYQPLPDDERYEYDENNNNIKSLFYDKFSEELSLSLPFFNKKDIFIQHYYYDLNTVTVGIYTGLDFFERNQQLRLEKLQSILSLSSSSIDRLQFKQLSTSSFQFNILQTTNVTALPTQIDSIYNQWSSLTTNFNNTPIKNQDANQFLGSIDPPQPLQDPACYDQGILGCSGDDPNIKSKKSMTGIIIGIVVAIVIAILLFILLVCILLWCRRNERGLWKSKEQQDKDEMSSFTFTPKQEYTKSTAAPSSTITTSSMVPMKANGVEMSSTTNNDSPRTTTTTTTIQSVNNHTELNDPTLPSNVKAYKDAKGQIFYVNSETMTTSWKHPTAIKADPNESNAGGDDYGTGW